MHQAFEYIHDYILIINNQNQILYCNNSLLSKLNYKTLTDQTLSSISQPNSLWVSERATQLNTQLLTLVTRTGEKVLISINIVKTTYLNQETSILVGQPFEEHYYTKKDLETLLDTIPFHIWIKDLNSNYSYINKRYAQWIIPNKCRQELLGQNEDTLWSQDILEYFRRTDRQILEAKKAQTLREVLDIEGKETHWQTHKIPIISDDGKVTSILGVTDNISDNHRVEIELARANRQLNILYDVAKASGTEMNAQNILDHIGEFIVHHLKANGIVLFEFDKSTNEFIVCSLTGATTKIFNLRERLPINEEVFNNLTQNNNLGYTSQVNSASHIIDPSKQSLEQWEAHGIKHLYRYFIREDDELLGMLSIGYADNYDPSDIDPAFLQTLCSQIHVVMKTTLLVEAAQAEMQKRKFAEKQALQFEKSMHIETMKNEFFTNMSHEFKTPINILLATNELVSHHYLENRIHTDENVDFLKYTKIVKQNSYRLLRLVNNLIDKTRIDTGQYPLHLSPHNIVNVIEETTLSVAHYIETKNIHLLFDTDIEECFILCDPEKIERIMLNLLSNAVKYVPPEGKIDVTITSSADTLRVSVKDNGIGIPKDKLDFIFQRFGQVDTSLTRHTEGSGIGLSLVYSLIKMHGGNIWVESTPGQGSNFIFELPISNEVSITETPNNTSHRGDSIEKCHIEFSDIYD